MERTEKIGLGLALAGHVVLFGLLSASWMWSEDEPPKQAPIDVSLVDDVGLVSQAPPAPEPPAQSRAPEQGPPEDAAPAAPVPVAEPDPVPLKPQPAPAPAPKPAEKAPPKPPVKPAEAKPDKTKTPPTKTATPPSKTVASAKSTGSSPGATKTRTRGSILDDDFRKGLSMTASESKAPNPPGAAMNAKAAADIGSAIVRQVQPCANRQVNPGPGASRIVVTVLLRINRDGSLAQRPDILNANGVDDENERYVDAVKRNAVATFMGCAPLRGLPADLYDVPRGWKLFKLNYRLP